MPIYLISFDIERGESEDYDEAHSIIKKIFSTNCKILTTTYLVKTSNSVDLDKEKKKIVDSSKKSMNIIIAKIESWSGRYLDAVDCVKKNIRN